jgi:hypothetical protein
MNATIDRLTISKVSSSCIKVLARQAAGTTVPPIGVTHDQSTMPPSEVAVKAFRVWDRA